MKNNPITRILVTLPIFIIILYRSYQFKINDTSIWFILIYILMIGIDIYIYIDVNLKNEYK